MAIFFLFLFIITALIAKKTNYTIFCEPLFWLGLFWILVIGVYLTAGVRYKYGFSIASVSFIIVCVLSLLSGRRYGGKLKTRVFYNEETKANLSLYLLLGLFGTLLFIWDYIHLNGITETKGDTTSSISLIGSIGSLFTPILLLLGLYYNAKNIKQKGSFSIFGIILVFCYSIPCMISAGRESILYGLIGVACIYGYNLLLEKRRKQEGKLLNKSSTRKVLLIVFSITIILFFGYTMLQISMNRFTSTEINILLSTSDVSSDAMKEAAKWGDFEFLYYNIASYFSQQIPFLDFTLKEYHGPYLFGLYELNIVSRRLPDFLGLDYRQVFDELKRLFSNCGEDFGNGWNTVLGSFITDFTWIGTIPACWLCGFALGKIKRKFYVTLDIRYITLIALLCLSAFSTIQLGPFFQVQIYGTYIWWFIIFRKEERLLI